MRATGTLIAIEGENRDNLKAQLNALVKQLSSEGYDVATFNFPRQEDPSGHFANAYIAGKYGQPDEVGPYATAIFYAIDRYEAAFDINQALDSNKVVIVSGYAGANMAKQGLKFSHPEERRGFYIWLDNLEFQVLGIPRPDRTFILMDTNNDKPSDLYEDLLQLFPRDFAGIDCVRAGKVLDAATILKILREAIQPMLPARSPVTTAPQEAKAKPEHKYLTPPRLNTAMTRLYNQKMDQIFDLYNEMARTVANDAIRPVLPVASMSELDGAVVIHESTNKEGLENLAHKYLAETLAAETTPVQMTDFWPRNELDLVADMLYEHSNLTLREIRKDVAEWSYDKKAEVMEAYAGERRNDHDIPGPALEKVHYSFDLVSDYGTFHDWRKNNPSGNLEWQLLTPRYGYEVPSLVQEAGLTEIFERCFDISLELYSQLQAGGYPLEAQYATLLGHKMRWKVTYNAREAFHLLELGASPEGHPGYGKLSQQMHEKLGEVHPILTQSMKFKLNQPQ